MTTNDRLFKDLEKLLEKYNYKVTLVTEDLRQEVHIVLGSYGPNRFDKGMKMSELKIEAIGYTQT